MNTTKGQTMTPLEWKILNAKEALADVPVQLALDEEFGAYTALDAVVKALRTMIFEVERMAGSEAVIPLPPPSGSPVDSIVPASRPIEPIDLANSIKGLVKKKLKI